MEKKLVVVWTRAKEEKTWFVLLLSAHCGEVGGWHVLARTVLGERRECRTVEWEASFSL